MNESLMLIPVFVILAVMVVIGYALQRAKSEIKFELGDYTDVLKIKISHPGNEDFMKIDINAMIYDGDNYLSDCSNPDQRYPAICHELIKIPGVEGISARKYELSFKRGECFDFDKDIAPRAIEIIKEFYGKGKLIQMLPTFDRREDARLESEAHKNMIRETGRDPYDNW